MIAVRAHDRDDRAGECYGDKRVDQCDWPRPASTAANSPVEGRERQRHYAGAVQDEGEREDGLGRGMGPLINKRPQQRMVCGVDPSPVLAGIQAPGPPRSARAAARTPPCAKTWCPRAAGLVSPQGSTVALTLAPRHPLAPPPRSTSSVSSGCLLDHGLQRCDHFSLVRGQREVAGVLDDD